MRLTRDARGQSVVIGSLLIFTVLILAFSGYQAFAVPDQNAEVEIDHFQENEDRFSEFRSNIVIAVGTEETRSTVFDLGARYPSRIAALNPPPAAGRLETTNSGTVDIEESSGSVDDLCSESGTTPTTRSLVYTPGYNEYREARAIGHESRVISREYDGSTIYDQRLVRGNTIDLILLNGTVSENGLDAYSLEIDGSSRKTETLNDPNITIPSRFNATTWNGEILDAQSDVTVTDPTSDRVKLNFTGGYRVSCAVVGLDGDPGFTPPDNGGGGGDSNTAYDISWKNPDKEPGTESCSADKCTLTESAKSVELTAETDPTARGAPVEFSVSDQSVATVSPETDNTGTDGEVTTTLTGQSKGETQVRVVGGGSGDVINFTITQRKTLDKGSTVIYKGVNATEGDNGTAKSLAPEGVKALGPSDKDLTGNGSNDLPYVKNENLKIVDSDGNRKTLVDNSSSNNPSYDADNTPKTLMAVGTWKGSDTSVFYTDKNSETIYRVDGSGTVTEVEGEYDGAGAVMGTGDIDGNGDTELIFADGSQGVRYLEQDGTTGKLEVTADSNNGIGVGQPRDFDGDGTVRAVIVKDGSIEIVGEAEPDESFGDTDVKKAPVTTADVDGDGELEIVYVGNDGGKIKYIDDPLSNYQIKFLRDENGSKIDAGDKLGVVS